MYTFALVANRVKDEAGNPLDGDGDGTGGDDYTFSFSLLLGDWNEDGIMDLTDYSELAVCLSGLRDAVGFTEPSQQCRNAFGSNPS